MKLRHHLALLASTGGLMAAPAPLRLAPFHASGIYSVGDRVGWTVTLASGGSKIDKGCTYTIKRNGLVPVQSGSLALASGKATIALTGTEPEMLYLEVKDGAATKKPIAGGAAVDPLAIQPCVSAPPDFDAFWERQIELLHGIPADAVLTPGQSDRPGVKYATIRLNNILGAHVYGQIAEPDRPGKFPAILIMQWASPPYPLQKAWVTDRAAQGWLAMNVEPHDVPCDMPAAFYAALPAMIKNYTKIYDDERNRNYFLRMYLGDYRALDYLAGRPDWNGKVLVAYGVSMGGQQSFAVSGLHPKVTHMIVDVPAGADSNAELHGRAPGYPNWSSDQPNVMQTALYFDTVNFAPHIKATCLVALGFVDTTCPPVGVWSAFNQIAGPKEAVPLIDSPHNNLATPEEQRPFHVQSEAWLDALVRGRQPVLSGPIFGE